MEIIYLDNNSSTVVAPEVMEVCQEELRSVGNPSSTHALGRAGSNKISLARRSVADFFKVLPKEIIFTSGGTEGINLLIHTLLAGKKGSVITSATEHSCVHKTLHVYQQRGIPVSFLNPSEDGIITAKQVADAISEDTALITIMAVNNETGVKNEWEEIAKVAEEKNIPFIVDGISLLGKGIIENIPPGVTGMAFSGHKFHAPKGIGFIYLKQAITPSPLFFGGHQENMHRAGTENTVGIVGIAKALELLENAPSFISHMETLRNIFEKRIHDQCYGVMVNGSENRICNTANLSFEDVDGESLLINLDMHNICASHGSACSSGAIEPSRILLNMGLSRDRARNSIRFSLSRYTTEEEIEKASSLIVAIVRQLRSMNK